MFNKAEDNSISFVGQVRRNDKVVKGGRRSSYSVLIIYGDKKGLVSTGFGKHKEVIVAKQKALTEAKKSLTRVNLKESRTIHHDISASHGATSVLIRSADRGTGIIAGGVMRLIFEALGIKDIVAKCIGSSCPHNLALATMKAFKTLRTPKMIAGMRNRPIDQVVRESRFGLYKTKRNNIIEVEKTNIEDVING